MGKKELFEKGPLYKAVIVMALPLTLSLMAVILYNLFGMYFLGQKGTPDMIAAVALGAPISTLVMAVGNILGLGGCSFLARLMGEGEEGKIRQTFSFCFWTTAAIGILIAVVIAFFIRPTARLLGASDALMEYTVTYLKITVPSIPFIAVTYVLTNQLRTTGMPTAAMIGSIGSTALNLFFSWLFIMIMEMGVAGAALAAALANVFGVVYYVIVIMLRSNQLSFNFKYYTVRGIIGPVLVIGVPIGLSYIFSSLAQVIMNNMLAPYGDIQIAAMAVGLRVTGIVTAIEIGFCNGVMPLFGYCYGAKLGDRLKAFIRFSTIVAIIMSVLISVLCLFFATPISFFLCNDASLTPIAAKMVIGLMCASPILGFFYIYSAIIQSLGKAAATTVLSLARQGVILVLALFILRAAFGLTGIIYAQAVSDVISTALSVIFYLHYRKEFAALKPAE